MITVPTHLRRTHLFAFLAVALLLGAFLAPAAGAQTPAIQATAIDSLAVELWPDYDQPSMLVLLSASLPADAALPAAVAIPLPPGAEINAVARFNDSNVLMSDVQYQTVDNRLILTTTSARFRVEYYAPYVANDNTHSYTFEWLSDLSVGQIAVVVQQPAAAKDIAIKPAPVGEPTDRGDGLQYFTLPTTSIAAGQPYSADVSYTVDSPTLSAPPAAASDQQQPATATTPADDEGALGGLNPWWIVLLVALVGVVGSLAWYLGSRQAAAASKSRKPKPERPTRTTTNNAARPSGESRFCHQCGTQARPGDSFCRKCGTQLKS